MTLTEFLLARITEDEADNRPQVDAPGGYFENAWHRQDCERNTYSTGPCDCDLPGRALAECESKRRIVEFSMNNNEYSDPFETEHVWADVLPALALPYADHPDYDEAWRP